MAAAAVVGVDPPRPPKVTRERERERESERGRDTYGIISRGGRIPKMPKL